MKLEIEGRLLAYIRYTQRWMKGLWNIAITEQIFDLTVHCVDTPLTTCPVISSYTIRVASGAKVSNLSHSCVPQSSTLESIILTTSRLGNQARFKTACVGCAGRCGLKKSLIHIPSRTTVECAWNAPPRLGDSRHHIWFRKSKSLSEVNRFMMGLSRRELAAISVPNEVICGPWTLMKRMKWSSTIL